MIQKIKSTIKKKIYQKFGFNIGTLRQKIEKDYRDQQKLLTGFDVQTIIDAGANTGQTTLKYKKLFPKSNIYGFEPYPDSYKKFKNNYQYDKFVTTEELALSDNDDFEVLNVNSSVCTNSLLKSEDPESIYCHDVDKQIETKKEIKIKTTTLDKYCEEKGIKNIDILKMDVQGGELKILAGAENLLSNDNIALIYSEVEFIKLYKDQPLFFDICDYLDKLNYTLYNLYNLSNAKNGQIVSGDAIFISKKIRYLTK